MLSRTLAIGAAATAAGAALFAPAAGAATSTPIPGGGDVTITYNLPALSNPATCATPPTIQYEIRNAKGSPVATLSTTAYPKGELKWSTGDAGAYTIWAGFPKPPCPVNDPTPPGVPYRYPVATGRSIAVNHYPGSVFAWRGYSFVSTDVGLPLRQINAFTLPAGTS